MNGDILAVGNYYDSALSFTASVQSGARGARCQQECLKAFAADGGESQEDVEGVKCCVALGALFHNWVGIAVRWCFVSLASAPPSLGVSES